MGTTRKRSLTVLFTCVGRRIELLQAFRASAGRLGVTLRIAGTDRDPTAPGLFCLDEPIIAPPISDDGYIEALVDHARGLGAAAVIPTIDTDLLRLSEARARFEEVGCTPVISPPDVVLAGRDKLRTYEFLKSAGVDTPETLTAEEALRDGRPGFPCFLKPRSGSAGISTQRIDTREELAFFAARAAEPIVQEFVPGTEHTVDVYCGLTGEPRCAVPRRRWAIRSGEVCKGVVVKDRRIMESARGVAAHFGGRARGLLTIQCIVTPEGRIRFIEINPRFGGGAPLGIAAGADYPLWLMQELLGEAPEIAFDGFRHGMAMLRYDWSYFVPLGDDLSPEGRAPLRPAPAFE